MIFYRRKTREITDVDSKYERKTSLLVWIVASEIYSTEVCIVCEGLTKKIKQLPAGHTSI